MTPKFKESAELERRARTSPIRFGQTTTSTPEQFIAGLTDFGPGRAEIFTNARAAYVVGEFVAHEETLLQCCSSVTKSADFTRSFPVKHCIGRP